MKPVLTTILLYNQTILCVWKGEQKAGHETEERRIDHITKDLILTC